MKTKILEVQNLNKSYEEFNFKNFFLGRVNERNTIFKNFNLHLNQGEILGISGKNGSGKTTLLKILADQISFNSGNINISNDIDIYYSSSNERSFFWRLSLLENLRLFSLFSKKEINFFDRYAEEFLSKFGLFEFKDIEFMKLSSGQKKKAIIIKSLILDSDVYLFDEISTNLDQSIKSEVYDVVNTLCKEKLKSFIWVSHDEHEMHQICHRIVNID